MESNDASIEYQVKDAVLSIDNGKVYDAKIMKIQEVANDKKYYFIHYTGWARKYDTWVDSLHLAKKGDEVGLQRLKELALESVLPAAKRRKKLAQKAGGKNSKQGADSNGRTVRPLIDIEVTETVSCAASSDVDEKAKKSFIKGVEVTSFNTKSYQRELLLQDLIDVAETDDLEDQIMLTYNMKKHLLNEWTLITKDYNSRLIRLPKRSDISAKMLFERFLEMKEAQLSKTQHKDAHTGFNVEEYREFLNGLEIQFSRAIPTLLLFRQERNQFEKLRSLPTLQNKSLSEIYGAEHLIRFFVRIPKLLTGVVLPKEAFESIFAAFNQLVDFLESEHEEYFDLTEYVPADEAASYMEMPPPAPKQRGPPKAAGSNRANKSKQNSISSDHENAETTSMDHPKKWGRKPKRRVVEVIQDVEEEVSNDVVVFNGSIHEVEPAEPPLQKKARQNQGESSK